MSKTAVVIVHFKGTDDTLACVNSLVNTENKNQTFSIIVVINPSEEDHSNLLGTFQKIYPQIIIIENKINTGFAGGNNIGIRKAMEIGSDQIILLNNDTEVPGDFINSFAEYGKSDKSIGLVSPKIYFTKGFEYHKDKYQENEKGKVIWYGGGIIDWSNIYASHRGVDEVDTGQFDQISETEFATGCCMLIKKEVIEKIGFLDEKYFLYYEDIDYSVRVKKAGYRVMYYPKSFIWHKNASSSGKPGSPIHIYYQTRNRLYFGFKYASFRVKKSLLIDSLKLGRKGGLYKRAVMDYYLGRMGKMKE